MLESDTKVKMDLVTKFAEVPTDQRSCRLSTAAARRNRSKTTEPEPEPGRTIRWSEINSPLIGGGVSYASSNHRDYADDKQIDR